MLVSSWESGKQLVKRCGLLGLFFSAEIQRDKEEEKTKIISLKQKDFVLILKQMHYLDGT